METIASRRVFVVTVARYNARVLASTQFGSSAVQGPVFRDSIDDDVVRPDAHGKIRFPGLNALRFFAAFSVLISHVQDIVPLYGKPIAVPAAFGYLPTG